jgi:serine protease
LTGGILAGSCGLFPLQGFYIFDLPQFPFRLLGSSIPELGNAVMARPELNPFFASVLIPFILIALFAGHEKWKWFAVGASIGVASCLLISAVMSPALWGLGSGALARGFLITNAILSFGLARLVIQERLA